MGAKQGRAKGNKQKAEYRNRERMHGKPGRKERGKRKKRKQKTSTEEAAVRQKQEERERKNQRLSSQNPKLKRPKGSENSGGQKVKRKQGKTCGMDSPEKPESAS